MSLWHSAISNTESASNSQSQSHSYMLTYSRESERSNVNGVYRKFIERVGGLLQTPASDLDILYERIEECIQKSQKFMEINDNEIGELVHIAENLKRNNSVVKEIVSELEKRFLEEKSTIPQVCNRNELGEEIKSEILSELVNNSFHNHLLSEETIYSIGDNVNKNKNHNENANKNDNIKEKEEIKESLKGLNQNKIDSWPERSSQGDSELDKKEEFQNVYHYEVIEPSKKDSQLDFQKENSGNMKSLLEETKKLQSVDIKNNIECHKNNENNETNMKHYPNLNENNPKVELNKSSEIIHDENEVSLTIDNNYFENGNIRFSSESFEESKKYNNEQLIFSFSPKTEPESVINLAKNVDQNNHEFLNKKEEDNEHLVESLVSQHIKTKTSEISQTNSSKVEKKAEETDRREEFSGSYIQAESNATIIDKLSTNPYIQFNSQEQFNEQSRNEEKSYFGQMEFERKSNEENSKNSENSENSENVGKNNVNEEVQSSSGGYLQKEVELFWNRKNETSNDNHNANQNSYDKMVDNLNIDSNINANIGSEIKREEKEEKSYEIVSNVQSTLELSNANKEGERWETLSPFSKQKEKVHEYLAKLDERNQFLEECVGIISKQITLPSTLSQSSPMETIENRKLSVEITETKENEEKREMHENLQKEKKNKEIVQVNNLAYTDGEIMVSKYLPSQEKTQERNNLEAEEWKKKVSPLFNEIKKEVYVDFSDEFSGRKTKSAIVVEEKNSNENFEPENEVENKTCQKEFENVDKLENCISAFSGPSIDEDIIRANEESEISITHKKESEFEGKEFYEFQEKLEQFSNKNKQQSKDPREYIEQLKSDRFVHYENEEIDQVQNRINDMFKKIMNGSQNESESKREMPQEILDLKNLRIYGNGLVQNTQRTYEDLSGRIEDTFRSNESLLFEKGRENPIRTSYVYNDQNKEIGLPITNVRQSREGSNVVSNKFQIGKVHSNSIEKSNFVNEKVDEKANYVGANYNAFDGNTNAVHNFVDGRTLKRTKSNESLTSILTHEMKSQKTIRDVKVAESQRVFIGNGNIYEGSLRQARQSPNGVIIGRSPVEHRNVLSPVKFPPFSPRCVQNVNTSLTVSPPSIKISQNIPRPIPQKTHHPINHPTPQNNIPQRPQSPRFPPRTLTPCLSPPAPLGPRFHPPPPSSVSISLPPPRTSLPCPPSPSPSPVSKTLPPPPPPALHSSCLSRLCPIESSSSSSPSTPTHTQNIVGGFNGEALGFSFGPNRNQSIQTEKQMQMQREMQREMRFDGESCGSNRRSRSRSGKGLKVVSGGKDKRR